MQASAMSSPTPDELQQQLTTLTSAVDALVTQFIRPNAQQALENQQTLSQVINLLDRHAQAIVDIDDRLDRISQQQEANTEAIAAVLEQITAFDRRLEETRQLVAQNASGIAQVKVLQQENAIGIAQLRELQQENAEAIAASTRDTEILKELMRSQLAGIIGNGRRIDRLEQQAS